MAMKLSKMFKHIHQLLFKTAFVQNVLSKDVNLECFKNRPSMRVKVGITLILFSYIVGWPAVGLLGIISFYLGKIFILIIGGPLIYGISHLLFFIGVFLAGKEYAQSLLNWTMKAFFEKCFGMQGKSSKSFSNIE
jgi:hypothetical protein